MPEDHTDVPKPGPKPEKDAALDTAASDAAIAEADKDTTDSNEVAFTLAGVEVKFDRRRLEDVRFLRLMQQRRDAVALDFLFGERTHSVLLDSLAGDDGLVTQSLYTQIWDKIGEATGTGNS